MGKPWSAQLIQGLSDAMAWKAFFLDDINPCFSSPLLKTVAIITRNDT